MDTSPLQHLGIKLPKQARSPGNATVGEKGHMNTMKSPSPQSRT